MHKNKAKYYWIKYLELEQRKIYNLIKTKFLLLVICGESTFKFKFLNAVQLKASILCEQKVSTAPPLNTKRDSV